MIDTHDMTQRLLAGCPHKTVVVIPCSGCIKGALDRVERETAEETRAAIKSSLREDWRNMEAKILEYEGSVGRLTKTNGDLRTEITDRERDIQNLREALKAAKAELTDLKLVRDTDQSYAAATKPARKAS